MSSHTNYYRAVLIGACMTVVVNAWEICSSYVWHCSRVNFGYLPMCLLMPFLILVLFINPAIKLVAPRFRLRPDELIVIFSMGLIGSIFPGLGLGSFLIGIIAAPLYYASPENQWGDYLFSYIPKWIAPMRSYQAVQWFFEGRPEGARIPWEVWVVPAIWWLLFITALFLTSTCLLVILRKQWVVRERLAYPLAEIPLNVVQESRGLLPAFTKERLFWFGFAIPLGIICWNCATYFYPEFPTIGLMRYRWLRVARAFPVLCTKVNPFVIAFAFLTNLDVLFSIWFFHALMIVEMGLFNRVGYTIGRADLWCGVNAAVGWQSFGAFLFMVLWGMWMARRHIADVLKKAWDTSHDTDDSEELISYRGATIGFVAGLLVIVLWLRCAGMEARVIAAFLGALFVLYLGVTKVVAQCGLVYFRGPMTAQSFAMHMLGSTAVAPSSMASLALSFGVCCDAKTSVATMMAHIAKLGPSIARGQRKLLLASTVLALVLGMAASFCFTLYFGYEKGAYNFGAWEFQSGNRHIINDVVSKMRSPIQFDWRKAGFAGGGMALMAVLTLLRYRFLWWPLHPVGLTVGYIWPIRTSAFSIFLAWACKLAIVRLGGMRAYQRARPFFLGMLIGYAVGVLMSSGIDLVWFYGQGHRVHHW